MIRATNLCLTKSSKILIMICCMAFLSASNVSFAQQLIRTKDGGFLVISEDDEKQERVETLEEWEERISKHDEEWGTGAKVAAATGTLAALYFGGRFLYNWLFPRPAIAPANPPGNGGNLPPLTQVEIEEARAKRLKWIDQPAFAQKATLKVPSPPATPGLGGSGTIALLPKSQSRRQETNTEAPQAAPADVRSFSPTRTYDPLLILEQMLSEIDPTIPLTDLEQIQRQINQLRAIITFVLIELRDHPRQSEFVIEHTINQLFLLHKASQLSLGDNEAQANTKKSTISDIAETLKTLNGYLQFYPELISQKLNHLYRRTSENPQDIANFLNRIFETEKYSEKYAIAFADIPPGDFQQFLLFLVKGLDVINK